MVAPTAPRFLRSWSRAWRARGGRSRSGRPAAFALALALAAVAVPAVPQDAEAPPADPADSPNLANPIEARSLEVALAALVERARLVERLTGAAAREYRRSAQRRRDALESLAQASRDLDQAAVRPRTLTVEQLEQLIGALEQARQRFESENRAVGRHLEDLRRLVGERDALSVRIADLRSRLPQQQDQLTGVWEVTWMPAGVVGTFYLDQSGTLVSGQYDLGTHGSGSLQGTFVSGKLFLQRIDSRRGRDAEIEGVLSADGRQIRGTWMAYEMSQGGTPHGQWVARRVQ